MKMSPMKPLLLLVFCAILAGCSSAPEIIRWEPTEGPYAQNIAALLVDESHHLYAGLTTGAVHGSTDHGSSWSFLTYIHPGTRIHRFIPHPENSRRLYAATDSGLFVSTDGGNAWTATPVARGTECRSLAIEPFHTSTMYAGMTGLGIFKSTNGGETWSPSNAGLDSALLRQAKVHDITIDLTQPEHIVAALSDIGVVASTNAGSSWSRLREDNASFGVDPLQILMHPRISGRMVLGMSGGTLYASGNNGKTWSPTRFGTGGTAFVTLALHPGNNEVVFAATENGVLVSSDFGTTWRTFSGRLSRLATSLALSKERTNPTIYVYGQGLGLQSSTDEGRTWVQADNGLEGATVTSIAGTRNDKTVYAVVGSGVYKLAPGGWVSASNGLTGGMITALAADADSISFAYASTEYGLFRTTNGGDEWYSGSQSMYGRHISHFAIHPIFHTRMFLANDDGLFVSTDRGQSWKPTRPLDGRYAINSMTFSPTNAGLVFGATRNQSVIRTEDGGLQWESSRYGLPEDDVRGISLDATDMQVAYAWTARGDGYRTTNGGIVWDKYTPPWTPGERPIIAIDKFRPSSAVALVGRKQLFHTGNGGATWGEIPIEPLKADPLSVYWTSRTGVLYIGTKEAGVYRLEITPYLKRQSGK